MASDCQARRNQDNDPEGNNRADSSTLASSTSRGPVI